ncbi:MULTISPECIES: LacI family DNA-binding transcriptional regulator [Streptomyces]|jgi:LacI family repressor for deo operon, udp, cdd, tsx, nupC, and nupG|uniref:LacI family transcriptional regulator n=2 Tax=Streptomyces TaxID=1883 RepID=A0AB37X8B7_9ACTN|nr:MULTISPECIES: LacI family DNA-binding transcriptional regulator [Streptomyces]MBO1284720.1 LacI family DNA-binding transcriptional regulator [Streptomyces sampsonii]MYX49039.1 substrate-binding domain-containing protein [Streptomyces sp. SID8385]QLA59299.1 LacI family DNA-binding transcriptional regulator [Streptomyces violascens]AGI90965.1 MalR repressor protein [Streptomyces albidoflavus]AWL31875.1 LacI family transcriptional regulator [Streptomyces sp. SM17]
MTARLADIAAQAGVSEATVSRVLNGKQGVAAATRESVLAALDVLGYERPVRLRRRSAGLVGLITPELENPIFPALAQVIGQALTRQGYTPVLATQTPGGSTEDELTEMLVDRGVSGIIFVSGLHADTTADMTRYDRLRGQGVPFVLIDGFTDQVRAPFISPDDRAAMRLAVTHLASLGHTRIGLALGPKRFVPVIRKTEGFTRALHDTFGIDAAEAGREFVRHSLYTLEGGQAAADSLLDGGCTAVVCASDMMALGAIRAVRRRGLDVPADVSVVGFDDSPLIAFTDPPLTTVRKPVTAMGQAAVRALLEEIGGTPAPPSEFVFMPELVVRGSTASAPPPDAPGVGEVPQREIVRKA